MSGPRRRRDVKSPFMFPWMTRFYDGYMSLRGFDADYYHEIIRMSGMKDRYSLLDVGCSTGTQLLEAKRMFPQAECVGIDPDPRSLDIARKKIRAENMDIPVYQGSAENMPFEEDAFDIVVSLSTFHHLTRKNKIMAAKEIFRVLRPGGQFLLVDFGRIPHPLLRWACKHFTLLEPVGENITGELLEFMEEAGFENIETLKRGKMFRTYVLMCKPPDDF